METLIDSHGRRISKLRISLLDTCNLRCLYCMPETMSFLPQERLLPAEEILQITDHLTQFGIKAIRVTGGEPTLRKEFLPIMKGLSDLAIDKLGVTSNGVFLTRYLRQLRDETKTNSINISLDSLNRESFHKITKRDCLDKVIDCLVEAQSLGFETKVNCVLMKGLNDHEILDFVDFSAKYGIEVRFLELMRIGQACKGAMNDRFMEADKAISIILAKHGLQKIPVPHDSTSFRFKLSNGAKIGFIASESKPFCGGCSRWRLTATGDLRACLMSEKGVSIKGVPAENYSQLLADLLPMKPTGRIKQLDQDMYQIGG
ncbi:MAG: GTP 3',8-cyclase MoaA [Pseudobacteriovorax sp.]|nr:GTP 3',8-cyclase MoaA [Pseudobacteriovorax sp.]